MCNNIIRHYISNDNRRRAVQTPEHLLFQVCCSPHEILPWQTIHDPLQYHPDTPAHYIEQLLTDWANRKSLKNLPTTWLHGKPAVLSAASIFNNNQQAG